jgi:hypothetical protein
MNAATQQLENNATTEIRELKFDELDQVTGGLSNPDAAPGTVELDLGFAFVAIGPGGIWGNLGTLYFGIG